jgi:hypothetical protein
MKVATFLSVMVLASGIASSRAADICKAVALRDIPAIENPEAIIKRGDYDTAITGYRVNKKTDEASFCSHGGYCYPTHLIENGEKVEALRLTNRKIGKAYEGLPDEIDYDVEVIRSKVSPAELKVDDLDNKLHPGGELHCSRQAQRMSRLLQFPSSKFRLPQSVGLR